MTSDFLKSVGGLVFKYNSYSKLVEELYLSAIVDSFKRIQKIPNINSLIENKIRNHLVYDLENNNQFLQPFLQANILKLTKENTLLLSPMNTKRTDIEFFISIFGDFVVECKNLRSAEQRYVDDGVQRFTNESYSKSDYESSMVGFIVGGNISPIISGLKAKVVKHKSSANCKNLLTKPCLMYQYSFHSEHSRKTQPPILIHHLFVDLQNAPFSNFTIKVF